MLFLLTSAVVAAVAATVLSANGGRNILALSKALHVDLRLEDLRPRRMPDPAPPAGGPVRPEAHRGWPWYPLPAAEYGLLQYRQPPADICKAMAEDGQETPSFITRENGSWECSDLREYAASSLFVQTRGMPDGSFSSFRIKFNLAADGMTEDLGDAAARLAAAGIRPLAIGADLEAALKQKMMSQANFYFLLGYYPVTFRQEFGEATRFNLIALNRPGPVPELWLRAIATTAKPPGNQTSRISRSSRLSAPKMSP